MKKIRSSAPKVRPPGCPPEEVLAGTTFIEGSLARIEVNRYERSTKARDACILNHGTRCVVCGFDFGEAYGELLSGFIHVHHRKPLSTLKTGYEIDPVNDLRPVCPNCHAVIHRREPPYDIEEVQQLLHDAKRLKEVRSDESPPVS